MHPMHRPTGAQTRVAVITGASSGVGRATAEAFAEQGYAVVLAARRAAELEEVARRCRGHQGARAVTVPVDLTETTAAERLARRAVETYGRIDVWVNGAAVAAFGPVDQVPPEVFRKVLDLNVLGYVQGARAALAVMRRQGSGTLINLGSVVGAVPLPYNTPYVLSKAAVRALGATLRQELRLSGHRDVHVCTVLPAAMDTPFFESAANYSGRRAAPMGPVYTPERAARKVLRLVSRPRREVFVGSAAAVLATQAKLTPGLVERLLADHTDRSLLSPAHPAPKSAGNTTEPLSGESPGSESPRSESPTDETPTDESAHGSWYGSRHGRRRTAARRLTIAGLLAGAGYTAVRRARRCVE